MGERLCFTLSGTTYQAVVDPLCLVQHILNWCQAQCYPNSLFVICTEVLCHGTSRLAMPTHLCHRWVPWWYSCQKGHFQVHRRPWWYLLLQPEDQRHHLLLIHDHERKRISARRWATCAYCFHISTVVEPEFLILLSSLADKYTFRQLWCVAITLLSVVSPPCGHNIWYKSCCTFTARMSGSIGSVWNTPKYLKSMYLLDLRRQTAMLMHEHAWDCTQLIGESVLGPTVIVDPASRAREKYHQAQ